MRSTRIMIIDDEVLLVSLLKRLLEKWHYEVETAHSIGRAREKLAEFQPALVFLDLHLPDGSGFSLLPYIRQLDDEMKVVLISAYAGSEQQKRAGAEGVDYFIDKPFEGRHIERCLNDLLS